MGGGWKHHLVGPSANSLFATLGVVADQSSSSSSSSPSLLTVEVRSTCSSGSSLQHVLEEFPGVLNTSKVLPKPTHRVEHILVTEGRPVKAKYRRLDNARLEAAKKEFAELEKQGIIRMSNSNWASPLHMVKKSEGTWRQCGDYRLLNL